MAMAVEYLTALSISDLTIAKPPFISLSSSSPLRLAIAILRSSSSSAIAVWNCSPSSFSCSCIAMLSFPHIVSFLASSSSSSSDPSNLPSLLDLPLSRLLPSHAPSVCHIDASASLLEALDLMVNGAQSLVVPVGESSNSRIVHESPIGAITQSCAAALSSPDMAHFTQLMDHKGQQYCWLTQEDVLRFLLGSINVFTPLPSMSVSDLGIIRTDVQMVDASSDAASALGAIRSACRDMSAVAVVDKVGPMPGEVKIVGEISCSSMHICNELSAIALATMSAGDFVLFLQVCANPPDILIDIITMKACNKLSDMKGSWYVHQSLTKLGDDVARIVQSPNAAEGNCAGRWKRWSCSQIARYKNFVKRDAYDGPIFCNPKRSLIAVILQCLAHRLNHAWVIGDDGNLVGIVTFSDILAALLNHIIIWAKNQNRSLDSIDFPSIL